MRNVGFSHVDLSEKCQLNNARNPGDSMINREQKCAWQSVRDENHKSKDKLLFCFFVNVDLICTIDVFL